VQREGDFRIWKESNQTRAFTNYYAQRGKVRMLKESKGVRGTHFLSNTVGRTTGQVRIARQHEPGGGAVTSWWMV
jgi:hypothetical protein